MPKYRFPAPMIKLAISSASLNIFFSNSSRKSSRFMGEASGSIDEENYFVQEGDRGTRLDVLADWAEKYFSAQSAEQNSTTSGTGSLRISSQGLFSS